MVSIAALIYIATQQETSLLLITIAEMAIGFVWWVVVIMPRRGKAWALKQPTLDDARSSHDRRSESRLIR